MKPILFKLQIKISNENTNKNNIEYFLIISAVAIRIKSMY